MNYEDEEPTYESNPSSESDGAVTVSPVSVMFDARAMFDSVVQATSHSVFQQSSAEITKAVRLQVSASISEKVGGIIDATLETGIQQHDQYGDPKGPPTTLKALIGKAGEVYLSERVDKDGNVNCYGRGEGTRLEYLIKKAIEKHIDYRLTREIEAAVKLATEKAQAKVGEVAAAMIMKLSK